MKQTAMTTATESNTTVLGYPHRQPFNIKAKRNNRLNSWYRKRTPMAIESPKSRKRVGKT